MHRLLSTAALALALSVAAFPAAAELAAWDQARVTDLAKQLAKACDDWQTAVLQQGGDEWGTGDAWSATNLRNQARTLMEQSHALHDALAKGAGHDKTLNMYRDFKEVMDDSDVTARRTQLDEPTMDAWSKVADLYRQISPYYDPKADTE